MQTDSRIQFWSSSWRFYEIAVGVYGGALTIGAVAFVQFPLISNQSGESQARREQIRDDSRQTCAALPHPAINRESQFHSSATQLNTLSDLKICLSGELISQIALKTGNPKR